MNMDVNPNILPHPDELKRLLAAKLWPSSHEEAIQQNLSRRISSADVASLMPTESEIFLHPNPRVTIAADHASTKQQIEGGADFLKEYEQTLEQIDPEKALFIADFGAGSDAPIALDFRTDQADPPVIGLQWSASLGTDKKSCWVQLAPSFSAFVKRLNLWDLPKFR
jgi:hypothetical protein